MDLPNSMALSWEFCFSRETVGDENLGMCFGLEVFRVSDLPLVILPLQPGATLAQIKLYGNYFLFYTLNCGTRGVAQIRYLSYGVIAMGFRGGRFGGQRYDMGPIL